MIAKIILIALMTISLGMSISDHGKKRKRQNGWSSLVSYGLIMGLLYWSGFFDNF
jgi:hypothetical protein